MGAFTSLVAAAALAQAGGFSFDGIQAEAETTGQNAFIATGADPSVQQFGEARGEARLVTEDRIGVPRATYGDKAQFAAVIRSGLVEYRIELLEAGAPPVDGEAQPPPFATPLEGGVRTSDVVFGRTGMGPAGMPPARSATSIFGRAQITRNGVVVDPAAPVQIHALATGVHADDDTRRRLPAARAEDTELIVYAPRIASDLVPNGYLLVTFEDVAISVAGRRVPSTGYVATSFELRPGTLPIVAELEDVPDLTPPNFAGFAQAPAAVDVVPIPGTDAPGSPQALNATPAVPLPQTVDVLNEATVTDGPTVGATQEAVPLPPTPGALNAQPGTTGFGGAVPGVQPLNATPATPLPPGVAPLFGGPDVVPPALPPGGAVPGTAVPTTPPATAPATP